MYRARDTGLKRDVALKVLPGAFARDPDKMGRFQREAEILASLNYPGIATIYGLAQVGDTRAIAMEFVEALRWPARCLSIPRSTTRNKLPRLWSTPTTAA